MLNLSDLVTSYINFKFLPEQQSSIFQAFSLFENMGLKYYEDKYANLITQENSLMDDNIQDAFLYYLMFDLEQVINSHGIYLDNDYNPTLDELNEIVHFLFIVQHLENYEYVKYCIYSPVSNRMIVANLICYFTLLSKVRVLELISDVESTFIEALKEFVEDKEESVTEPIDKKHLKLINAFRGFTENYPSLGLKYYDMGFSNLTLEELLNIVVDDIAYYIDEKMTKDPAEAALDVLSLLIISKDSYELPLLKFQQFNSLLTNKTENITRLNNMITDMLNDFYVYLEAEREKERVEHYV